MITLARFCVVIPPIFKALATAPATGDDAAQTASTAAQPLEIAMSIDADAIEKVARLARIRLDPADVPALTDRIGNILAMVDRLQAVDTAGVEPLSNPCDASQRLRADAVSETDQRERFQAIAPSTEQGLYLVPRVIE